ncbi:MAG: ATP-binding cassette domain-containing protein [Bacteroidetes bacterium]|nr:ATP-binding cassette domain-containing protein [Bacteroidota bacterium]
MPNILEVRNVSKAYDKHVALENVSITINEGSVFGLLGPNGAGKTSLIRIINQITAPDSGHILFDGKPLNPQHTAQIGYLPEERGLYKKMEVGEQVLYLAQLKGLSRADAVVKLKYWFEKFEIKGWWKKKVEELSKGMQQKVQFIVTVVHEPKLLILDEPFTGFDPINANLIKDELIEMRKKGTTIALSTHRMESVEELCTHIALINKSRKLLEGPVKDVRKLYKSNVYAIEYEGTNIGLANSMWGDFELIENEPYGDGMKALIKVKDSINTNALLQGLINNVTIHSFKELIPTMNDIFIQSVTNNEIQTIHE